MSKYALSFNCEPKKQSNKKNYHPLLIINTKVKYDISTYKLVNQENIAMSILFTTSISLTDNLYPDAKKQIPKRKKHRLQIQK